MDTDNLALRPNCLLTKYPLVFISGVRSLFYYDKLGPDLQDYIAAHGYQVLSPVMPFRSQNLRRRYLQYWLENQNGKRFHFVLSSKTHLEFKDLLEKYENSNSSSTFSLSSEFADSTKPAPLHYQLHRLFCLGLGIKTESYSDGLPGTDKLFLDRFLDHCIDLAENE